RRHSWRAIHWCQACQPPASPSLPCTTLVSTDWRATRPWCWKTTPIRRRSRCSWRGDGEIPILSPSVLTMPPSRGRSPIRHLSRVDLPAPFEPTSATRCASETSSPTSQKTVFPSAYVFVSPRARMISLVMSVLSAICLSHYGGGSRVARLPLVCDRNGAAQLTKSVKVSTPIVRYIERT